LILVHFFFSFSLCILTERVFLLVLSANSPSGLPLRSRPDELLAVFRLGFYDNPINYTTVSLLYMFGAEDIRKGKPRHIDDDYRDCIGNDVLIRTFSGEEREIRISRQNRNETREQALVSISEGFAEARLRRDRVGYDLESLFRAKLGEDLKWMLDEMQEGTKGTQLKRAYSIYPSH